jgi:hypothetical protein
MSPNLPWHPASTSWERPKARPSGWSNCAEPGRTGSSSGIGLVSILNAPAQASTGVAEVPVNLGPQFLVRHEHGEMVTGFGGMSIRGGALDAAGCLRSAVSRRPLFSLMANCVMRPAFSPLDFSAFSAILQSWDTTARHPLTRRSATSMPSNSGA